MMSNPLEKIGVIVGSQNPVKVAAAKEGFLSIANNREVVVIPFKADPGIVSWRSLCAVGQPFGSHQTAFGAINRMKECWKKGEQLLLNCETKYAIGFENGLVSALEVGQTGPGWFDVCFVAIQSGNNSIIKRGKFVKTEFSPPSNNNQKDFDQAVMHYEQQIMPKINRKEDLYLEWTKNTPGGPQSRDYFLKACQHQALQELDSLQHAHKIVDECVKFGMTASAGPRYNSMLWTRDLAYMAPVYLQKWDSRHFLEALRTICKHQFAKHELYNNGYETFDRFGNIPIVCLSEPNERLFLQHRIRGSMQDPSWQIHLWNFTQINNPSALAQFPYNSPIEGRGITQFTLDHFTLDELKKYYHDLLSFVDQLKNDGLKPPNPSFALRAFMEGKLENLTPGTRDSEIQFIRSVFYLIKHDPINRQALLEEFSPYLAKAICYLYNNVIDAKDGLPYGADSRDIFADLMYDSKVLTNAVFWCQALELLVEFAPDLKKAAFLSTIENAVKSHIGNEVSGFLIQMIHKDLEVIFKQELNLLKGIIQIKFLFKIENFNFEPKDFIPGKRAGIALDNPVNPSPIDTIIKKDNPQFPKGQKTDPQSLAHAVLTHLIFPEHYDKVIQLFSEADSKIGVQVFVPISGKTEQETILLQKVKGQVVWPHVTWSVVRALIAMGTERSLNMAEEQRDKLMQLGGCSEWYAIDPDTQEPIKGGDPLQGWAATTMMMALEDFNQFYSHLKP